VQQAVVCFEVQQPVPAFAITDFEKNIENISQDIPSLGQNLNMQLPEYKARLLTTQPQLLQRCRDEAVPVLEVSHHEIYHFACTFTDEVGC
jgi:hypothetical protein